MQRVFDPVYAVVLLAASAVATALLIWVLHPWLVRYALARPNARSSHSTPTPQGGGIAVILAIGTVLAASAWFGAAGFRGTWVVALLLGMVALAVAGAIDDIRPLPVLPRLLVQLAVAAVLVGTLPFPGRVLALLPGALESALLVVGLVWFINLTNFMDGLDLMTVVEVVPIAACLAVIGYLGLVPEMTSLMPLLLALAGAMLGFAPWNRHVARLFLGDVGSLPLGALVGWLLIVLAQAGQLAAALILPLYYLADATITLVRRWRNGERISQAHRSHFYQRAVAAGMTVPQVTREVLALNVVLASLALIAVQSPRIGQQMLCVTLAVVATLLLLRRFEKGGGAARPTP